MRPRLLLKPEAEADIAEAFDWYEAQGAGLGAEFLAELARVLEAIERRPEQSPVVQGRTRRALVRRFPFGVFYIVEPDLVAVTACMHSRRDPRRWQARRQLPRRRAPPPPKVHVGDSERRLRSRISRGERLKEGVAGG